MPTTEQLTQEVEKELTTTALTVINRSKAIKISDQLTYDDACSLLLNDIKPMRKRWADFWRGADKASGPLSLAYKTYDSLLQKFNQADKPLEAAEKSVKAEIGRWEQGQARLKEEAQIAAQKAAEDEARLLQEQEAEYAAMAGASEEQVAAISSAPVHVVAAPVESTFQRASGVSTRSKWVAVVTNLRQLAAAIGKGTVPTSYIQPDQSALDKRAAADKNLLSIPGVVAREEKIVAGRSRF